MPISILDLRDTYEIGGPGKTILETYRAIDRDRFRMHLGVFLTRQETDASPFVAAARATGMPVHLIRGFNQYDLRMVWRLAALVRELGVDIVHAHEVKSDVVAYLASRVHRVPIVTTLHGWFGTGRRHRFLIALDRRVVRRFDRVMAVSDQIARSIAANGAVDGKVSVLHNGIVLERYRRTGVRGGLAELAGREVPSPVIASIGRISPEKGHADLIDAFAILASRGCRISGVLVGDGPARSALADRIRALRLERSVFMLGYLQEPQRVLEETDLMVLPSHTEGLPNAALEALAMEVPVLATRVGGTPEVIADGETGRLVPSGSPEALAAAILEFASDPHPWREMARRGRVLVETRFNFQHRTRQLEHIYSEVVARASR